MINTFGASLMTCILIIARWTDIWASVLLASIFVFEFVIVGPSSTRHPVFSTVLFGSVPSLSHNLAWKIWLVGIISSLLWLWTVAASMTGVDLAAALSPNVWATILINTQFGHLWIMRLTTKLIFGLSLWFITRTRFELNVLKSLPAALAILQLISLAWAGHAAAGIGAEASVHLINDAVHLAVAAFWPGGLVPLAVFLTQILKSQPTPVLKVAGQLTRRFSMTSLIAVAALCVTGLVNSIFLIGNVDAVLTTTYGKLLLWKLALFFSMVCLGAWNLLVLKPKLAVDVESRDVADNHLTIRSLLRNVLWEIGLGTAVFLIVGILGITSPPMH
jgi:copper resistance protein D